MVIAGWVSVLPVASAASASTHPVITATTASFAVPTGSGVTSWRLRLWSAGTLEGTAVGSAGTLAVPVPSVKPCVFQADVTATPAHGAPYYYSGFRTTLPSCGPTASQTLAIDIDECSPVDTPTTTEVPGGTAAAVGVDPIPSQPNPVVPRTVGTGTYSLVATAPPGFSFVGCGSSTPVIGSGATSASMTLTVVAGSSLDAVFYVVAPPTAAGGGSPSPGAVGPSGPLGGPPSNPVSPVAPAALPGHSPTLVERADVGLDRADSWSSFGSRRRFVALRCASPRSITSPPGHRVDRAETGLRGELRDAETAGVRLPVGATTKVN